MESRNNLIIFTPSECSKFGLENAELDASELNNLMESLTDRKMALLGQAVEYASDPCYSVRGQAPRLFSDALDILDFTQKLSIHGLVAEVSDYLGQQA